MAIFGGTGELRDPETEQEIYEHILRQQMQQMGLRDDEETVVIPIAEQAEAEPEPEPEEQVGVVEIHNFYTGEVVAGMDIWLCNEAQRHEHFDEDVERPGKFLVFDGSRVSDGSPFRLHIELDDTVEATLRAVGACAYKGDVPGSAMNFEVELPNVLYLAHAGSNTWHEILEINSTNIHIEMSMRNPHAVVVSDSGVEAALARNKKILKQIKKQ
jgi:hypothetical protein